MFYKSDYLCLRGIRALIVCKTGKLTEKLVIVEDHRIRATGHFQDLAFGQEKLTLLTGT